MRSIEEDSFEPFACKMESEIDTSFGESIAKIISSLEEDNDESSYKTELASSCKLTHNSTQSFENINEGIFENIFAEYKTKLKRKTEKLENSFTCSQMSIKYEIEFEAPKFSKSLSSRNLSLWDEFDDKFDLNPCIKCSVKLVKLPNFFDQFFKEIPSKSLIALGLKRKLELTTSQIDIKEEKRVKSEVESNLIPTSNLKIKSKPTPRKGKTKSQKQKQKSGNKQKNKKSAKPLPVLKAKMSNAKDRIMKTSFESSNHSKVEEVNLQNETETKNHELRSDKKATTVKKSTKSTSKTRVKQTKNLRSETKSEFDDFSLESKTSSKITYENFIPQLTAKNSRLREDGVEKFLRKRYIIISNMPSVPRKSILTPREGAKKSSKQVSFCNSIFIRRFVAGAHEQLDLS